MYYLHHMCSSQNTCLHTFTPIPPYLTPVSQRTTFIQSASQRDQDLSNTHFVAPSRVSLNNSRPATPTSAGANYNGSSGYMTPRELREETWRQEAEEKARPTKNEMREMYKELGGRKAKTKGKFGGSMGAGGGAGLGVRDKGGWANGGDDGW
jgi:hypothetical protein